MSISKTPADETRFEPHPLCLLLPDMSAEEFASLKDDIQAHGLRHPILMFEDKILDGRHRARACDELGIVARFEPWTGTDPVAFVLSENLHRRHLTPSQKAMIAAAAIDLHREAAQARMTAGKAPASRDATPSGKAAGTAAAAVGVGQASVERALQVIREGTADDVRAVKDGEATVKAKVREIAARPAIINAGSGEVFDTMRAARSAEPAPKLRSVPDVYLKTHCSQAAHLAKVAKDLKAAMGSGHRAGVPIADALKILDDIRSSAEKLAASLAKLADKEARG